MRLLAPREWVGQGRVGREGGGWVGGEVRLGCMHRSEWLGVERASGRAGRLVASGRADGWAREQAGVQAGGWQVGGLLGGSKPRHSDADVSTAVKSPTMVDVRAVLCTAAAPPPRAAAASGTWCGEEADNMQSGRSGGGELPAVRTRKVRRTRWVAVRRNPHTQHPRRQNLLAG